MFDKMFNNFGLNQDSNRRLMVLEAVYRYKKSTYPVSFCPECKNPLYPTKATRKYVDIMSDDYDPEKIVFICPICKWDNAPEKIKESLKEIYKKNNL